jgi:alpha-ketoglutarate-dependent taurine dioxygenase
VFLHLAMTGAVVHSRQGNGSAHAANASAVSHTVLSAEELASLLARFNELYEDETAALHLAYRPGDMLMIDNWAVAHRARAGSYDGGRGLRVVHRTTVNAHEGRNLSAPAAMRLPDYRPGPPEAVKSPQRFPS